LIALRQTVGFFVSEAFTRESDSGAEEIPADQEKIAFGATVTVRSGNGAEETYQIVGVEEANPEHRSIGS
jgi:transcription elongation GreA/GreB family factor